MTTQKSWLNYKSILLFGIVGLTFLAILLIKAPQIDESKLVTRKEFGSLSEAVNTIENQEKSFEKMRPDNEKKFYLSSAKEATDVGIVYIPGFSATRKEISPVVENVAQELRSHLFMSRLTGHGQTAEEFANIRAEDFLSDGLEALQVSKVLGKKKIWVATSTGALVALWIAMRHPEEVESLILVSPAFDILPSHNWLLAGHFGSALGQWLVGPYREWKATFPEQEKYWHTRYRSEALTALTRLISWANALDLAKLKMPVLILFTPYDEIVDTKLIQKKFTELGSKKKSLIVIPSKDHVLAGDITSPDTTARVIKEMITWINELPR